MAGGCLHRRRKGKYPWAACLGLGWGFLLLGEHRRLHGQPKAGAALSSKPWLPQNKAHPPGCQAHGNEPVPTTQSSCAPPRGSKRRRRPVCLKACGDRENPGAVGVLGHPEDGRWGQVSPIPVCVNREPHFHLLYLYTRRTDAKPR